MRKRTMDNLQDRQDVPIWNAVEAKNYKQALKLVDKRLAKKPTDYLEVRNTHQICAEAFSALAVQRSEDGHVLHTFLIKKLTFNTGCEDLYPIAFTSGLREIGCFHSLGRARKQEIKSLRSSCHRFI